MSASNWAVCPRCLDQAVAVAAARVQAVDAYGKVPPEEYERLRAEADVPFDRDALKTFREDYEFYGVEDGTIVATYEGGCSVCGLAAKFEHEHPFYSTGSDLDLDPMNRRGTG